MDLKNITVTDIVGATTVYSKKGKLDQTKNRKHYALSLCIDGQITYIQNGKECVSSRGYAVILPKGETYYIKRNQTGRFPVINFECLENLCDTVTAIPIENPDDLLADYETLTKSLCKEGHRAKVLSIFYGMLHKIGSGEVPRELSPALRMINAQFQDATLANARLAKACNVSEVYFRKLFKAHFGISPKQFIIDIRLRRASQLLTEARRSISEISEATGFSNQYHFSRIFKERFGVTPSEYRKANMTFGI